MELTGVSYTQFWGNLDGIAEEFTGLFGDLAAMSLRIDRVFMRFLVVS